MSEVPTPQPIDLPNPADIAGDPVGMQEGPVIKVNMGRRSPLVGTEASEVLPEDSMTPTPTGKAILDASGLSIEPVPEERAFTRWDRDPRIIGKDGRLTPSALAKFLEIGYTQDELDRMTPEQQANLANSDMGDIAFSDFPDTDVSDQDVVTLKIEINMGRRSSNPTTPESTPELTELTPDNLEQFIDHLLNGGSYVAVDGVKRLVLKSSGMFDVVDEEGRVVAGNISKGRLKGRFASALSDGRTFHY